MNQTINISLPKSLADLSRQQVKNGYYSSFSEVVRDALRKLLSTTPKPIKLSTKTDKRYNKMIHDLKSGKVKGFTTNNVDELMKYLGS